MTKLLNWVWKFVHMFVRMFVRDLLCRLWTDWHHSWKGYIYVSLCRLESAGNPIGSALVYIKWKDRGQSSFIYINAHILNVGNCFTVDMAYITPEKGVFPISAGLKKGGLLFIASLYTFSVEEHPPPGHGFPVSTLVWKLSQILYSGSETPSYSLGWKTVVHLIAGPKHAILM